MTRRKARISSVLELSRYKIDDVVWCVMLRHTKPVPDISEEDEWMANHHPKALYERGPYRCLWPGRSQLPKLQHMDFGLIMSLMIAEFCVEPFTITDIIRSKDTAEFFYANFDDEWMPESSLFCTDIAARRERSRILGLIKKWASKQLI